MLCVEQCDTGNALYAKYCSNNGGSTPKRSADGLPVPPWRQLWALAMITATMVSFPEVVWLLSPLCCLVNGKSFCRGTQGRGKDVTSEIDWHVR